MRANKAMADCWVRADVDGALKSIELESGLRSLAASRLIRSPHGCVLEPLNVHTFDPVSMIDETGFEAFTNKIHVADYLEGERPEWRYVLVQGILYAIALREQLGRQTGRFRILLSLDQTSNEVTVRFHQIRRGLPWISENPDEYEQECAAIWETPDASGNH